MMQTSTGTLDGVWSDLVGQAKAVELLRRAVSGGRNAMSHAWLITGPPGSGRSNAARAFAAALQCLNDGCGECLTCRTSLNGAHPDVTLIRTEKLSIGVEEVRELVRKASMTPTNGAWQIVIVEDADRITERGADALLKGIEEPPARTVWMLCAPSSEDVIVTIRSRTRKVHLTTPDDALVAELLVRRDGIEPVLAQYAAKAAQGHIGRARALARDPEVMRARRDVLLIPASLTSVEACLRIAQGLIDRTEEQAKAATAEIDERERTELQIALGIGTKGVRRRDAGMAIKDLEDQQRLRLKRIQRDGLDRVLTELTTWYRDVLGVQTGALAVEAGEGPELINADLRNEVIWAAESSTPEQTLRRIDALLRARAALEINVTPLLAMEALLLELASPES